MNIYYKYNKKRTTGKYCEAESKPDNWNENWADGFTNIVWGYKEN